GEGTSLLWQLTLAAKATVTGKDLLRLGTFDAQADERLVGLRGDAKVPLVIKLLHLSAASEEELTALLVDRVPAARQSLESSRYDEVKRSLVGAYLAKRFQFDSEI